MILVLERDGGAEPVIISKNLPLEDPLTLALPAGETVRMTMLAYPCSLEGHGLPNDVTPVPNNGLPLPEPAVTFTTVAEGDVIEAWEEIEGVPESIRGIRIAPDQKKCGYRVLAEQPLRAATSTPTAPVRLVPVGDGRFLAIPQTGPYFVVGRFGAEPLSDSTFPGHAPRAAGTAIGPDEFALLDTNGDVWLGSLDGGIKSDSKADSPRVETIATIAAITSTNGPALVAGFGSGAWFSRVDGGWRPIKSPDRVGRKRLQTAWLNPRMALFVLDGDKHVEVYTTTPSTRALAAPATGAVGALGGFAVIGLETNDVAFVDPSLEEPKEPLDVGLRAQLITHTRDGLLLSGMDGGLALLTETWDVCMDTKFDKSLGSLASSGEAIGAVPEGSTTVWFLAACSLPSEPSASGDQ